MSVQSESVGSVLLPEWYFHDGPWTEEDYLALPEDNARIELLDGALLVNPPPTVGHQRLLLRLATALTAACPTGMEVMVGVGVRLTTGRLFIPDISVVSPAGLDVKVFEARDVLLALEIVSPGSVATDRAVKPRLYAESGIPTYVRVEKADPSAHVFRLVQGAYVGGTPEPTLRMREPFPVEVDLAGLMAADAAE